MTEPTKGLRLAFKDGMLGLHFVADEKPYPEASGPADMAYINRLIEEDERERHTETRCDWMCRACTAGPFYRADLETHWAQMHALSSQKQHD